MLWMMYILGTYDLDLALLERIKVEAELELIGAKIVQNGT